MKKFLRGIGFLALSVAVGEIVRRLLHSRVGEKAMTRLGHAELATIEGAHAASREAKRAVGLVKTLTEPKSPEPVVVVAPEGGPAWVSVARDSAEMLLAAGTLLRVASDFVGENAKLQKRVERKARRR